MSRTRPGGGVPDRGLGPFDCCIERPGSILLLREHAIRMDAGGQLQESGERLHARALVISKPGDRIGLQVMHLPNGWSYVSDDLEMLDAMPGSFRAPVSRISNRIEFTAR